MVLFRTASPVDATQTVDRRASKCTQKISSASGGRHAPQSSFGTLAPEFGGWAKRKRATIDIHPSHGGHGACAPLPTVHLTVVLPPHFEEKSDTRKLFQPLAAALNL
jgi:hypothetical protein